MQEKARYLKPSHMQDLKLLIILVRFLKNLQLQMLMVFFVLVTTVRPNVGQIIYKDLRQISMADLPGLIEGAYANKGMGHSFLKHVERTKLLLLVVDINGFQLAPKYPFRSCLDTIALLNRVCLIYLHKTQFFFKYL